MPHRFPPSRPRRLLRKRWSPRLDVLTGVDVRIALVVLLEVIALIANGSRLTSGHWAAQAIGLILAFAGLLLQRTRPDPGLVLVFAATVAMPLEAAAIWPLLAAILEAGSRQPVVRAVGWTVAAALAASLQRTVWSLGIHGFATELVALGLAVAVGLWLASRGAARQERRARELEREQLVAQRSTAEERASIAREVHDIVAHTLTLIVVQAQLLAQRTSDQSARDHAQAIEQSARDAVGELQRTVELIRGDAPRAPRAPLFNLEAIVAQTRATGLNVTLTTEGKPQPLPTALEQSAVRIVQEALTNCAKHAPAANVSVMIRQHLHQIELEIADDGNGSTSRQAGGGMGLVGMRERVALHGGSFSAGPRTPTGFHVQAVLPIVGADGS